MTFLVTFLLAVTLLIIRHSYRVYKEPAAVLGRQAANMNWVAVGQVKDSDGYNNVRFVRDGMEAVVSFQEGNVSLVHPINETFNDFEELEQSLNNLDNEMPYEEALKAYEDLYEETKNDFESWDEDEDETFSTNNERSKKTLDKDITYAADVIKEFEQEVQTWPLDAAEAALSLLKNLTKGGNVDFEELYSKLTVKQFAYVYDVCQQIFPIDEEYDED
jgi:hypothetical protein